MAYRNLTESEIRTLESQGCFAENWNSVVVHDPVDLQRIRFVHFLGDVTIGSLSLSEPSSSKSGLYHSKIADCTIGNNVLVEHVGCLSRYEIGDEAVIRNVNSISMGESSTFGNGVEINVLNEAGGREIKIFDHLSAQLAYCMAVFRHRPKLIEILDTLIKTYVKGKKRSIGYIGQSCLIENSKTIIDVYLHPYAQIHGAEYVENGTIISEREAPSMIGHGVDARDFIVQSGSKLDSQVIVSECFIGQSVKLEKQFSAEHSAFFANSEGMHGEACSLFAGPYSVSHHKSTLLIAAMISFYNAGSGTNQSNHMYKLGPVHQGIMERGAKTGSFSYLLWPSRVAPFSVVLGKHYANFDASDLPCSYVNEDQGKSVVTPAMNLFTVGTLRDSQKWPTRDRRKGTYQLDKIHFDFWNPYLAERIERAISVLGTLSEQSNKKQEYVAHKGFSIKRLMLKTCRKYYEIALKIYVGEQLTTKLHQQKKPASFNALKEAIAPSANASPFHWTDAAGWLVPQPKINRLMDSIEAGEFSSIFALYDEIQILYDQYADDAWDWCCSLLERLNGKPFKEFNKDDYLTIIQDWADGKEKWLNMIIKDAEKEFAPKAQIGYGLGCSDDNPEMDFNAVRGSLEENRFVQHLYHQIKETKKQGEVWRGLISELK